MAYTCKLFERTSVHLKAEKATDGCQSYQLILYIKKPRTSISSSRLKRRQASVSKSLGLYSKPSLMRQLHHKSSSIDLVTKCDLCLFRSIHASSDSH